MRPAPWSHHLLQLHSVAQRVGSNLCHVFCQLSTMKQNRGKGVEGVYRGWLKWLTINLNGRKDMNWGMDSGRVAEEQIRSPRGKGLLEIAYWRKSCKDLCCDQKVERMSDYEGFTMSKNDNVGYDWQHVTNTGEEPDHRRRYESVFLPVQSLGQSKNSVNICWMNAGWLTTTSRQFWLISYLLCSIPIALSPGFLRQNYFRSMIISTGDPWYNF